MWTGYRIYSLRYIFGLYCWKRIEVWECFSVTIDGDQCSDYWYRQYYIGNWHGRHWIMYLLCSIIWCCRTYHTYCKIWIDGELVNLEELVQFLRSMWCIVPWFIIFPSGITLLLFTLTCVQLHHFWQQPFMSMLKY